MHRPRSRHGDHTPTLRRRVQLTAALSTGSSAAAKFLTWTGSAWTATNTTLTVHDGLSQFSASSGEKLWVAWMPAASRWEVLSGGGFSPGYVLAEVGEQAVSAFPARIALAGAGPTAVAASVDSFQKITVSTTATWEVTATILVRCNTASFPLRQDLSVLLYKNGSAMTGTRWRVSSDQLVTNLLTTVRISWLVSLAAGDYVECWVEQNTGTATWDVARLNLANFCASLAG